MHRYPQVLATILAALFAPSALSSELGYSYLDFSVLNAWADDSGQLSPVAGQTVEVSADQGDGLAVVGGLAIAQRGYIQAGYRSAVIDVDAVVTSPPGTTAPRSSTTSAASPPTRAC
mgnify:CR=1 FL=1